ncbi:hypothetical protein [Bacillus sp. Au-Bac7]|uniref:hypothetical protein n=1 Tax=Bacillus sp. Au-Bac7 TaxID=2906458 RepID=UPI001E52A72F|nr:hypothetical protein [Bacillus sp. Au-Bac7]MCE4049911.1 hypothetical protein [Bacillus sp. Au-Bac7]
MSLQSTLNNFFSGNLNLFDGAEEKYELTKAHYDSFLSHDFARQGELCINDLIYLAEITQYKKESLSEMTVENREIAKGVIIKGLGELPFKPVGYEVRENSIVVCWYVVPFYPAPDPGELPGQNIMLDEFDRPRDDD